MELPRLPFRLERFASLVGHPHFWHMRLDYQNLWGWTHFYEVDLLRPTLEKYISYEKINSGDTNLILGATDVESGKFVEFCNFGREGQKATKIRFEHIMASGSIPPGFPMTEIDGRHYWDGGLINSMPLKPVTDALKELHPNDVKLIYAIALRPLAGAVPTHMWEVYDRMLEIIYGDKSERLENDIKQLKTQNGLVLAKNQVDYAKAIRMDRALRAPVPPEPDGKTKYQHFIPEVYIPYRESTRPNSIEDIFGTADFTRLSIEQRIKMGRENAEIALNEKGVSVEVPMGVLSPASLTERMPDDGDGHDRMRAIPAATASLASRRAASTPQASGLVKH